MSAGRKVCRARIDSDTTVIVKLWTVPRARGLLRAIAGRSAGRREYQTLKRMIRAGVRVPRPLGYFRVRGPGRCRTEVLFLEDLGRCAFGGTHLRALVDSNSEAERRAFEDEVIALTQAIVRLRVLDPDYSINNIIYAAGDAVLPARIVYRKAAG